MNHNIQKYNVKNDVIKRLKGKNKVLADQNKQLLDALINRVKSHFADLYIYLPCWDGELIDFFKDDIKLIEEITKKKWSEINETE